MSLYDLACAFAERLTAFNRSPLTIMVFVPACLAFIALGWVLDRTELFLLIITTALSVDASLGSRTVQLKQAKQDGDLE